MTTEPALKIFWPSIIINVPELVVSNPVIVVLAATVKLADPDTLRLGKTPPFNWILASPDTKIGKIYVKGLKL